MGVHDEDVRHAQRCPECGKYYDPEIYDTCPHCEQDDPPEEE